MHDGRVIPSAIVLSHREQLGRLAQGCPEALPVAHVAGDPCLDQLMAGRAFRETYRRALGLLPGQRLVVVSSTWGRDSLLGSPRTGILRRALAELPAEEFRILAAIHPNAWYAHGAWQIRAWLAPLLDHGLILPAPESETWKSALCAADFLAGDSGSLSLYGVEIGIPTVLGAFQDSVVAPDSPMRKLGDLLPRLDPTRPLLDQFTRAAETQRDDPRLAALRGSVTSEPGRSTALLRRLLYSQLQLPEPPHPAATRAIPVPSIPAEDSRRLPHLPAMAVTAEVGEREATVFVRRYPGALQGGRQGHLTGAHLTADPDDPDPRWPRSADVLVLPRERCPRSEAVKWSDFAARYPACGLVAVEESDRGCTLLFPDETRVRARWIERPAWASFAIAASALHAWTEPVRERLRIEVRAGDDPAPALLEVDPAP